MYDILCFIDINMFVRRLSLAHSIWFLVNPLMQYFARFYLVNVRFIYPSQVLGRC